MKFNLKYVVVGVILIWLTIILIQDYFPGIISFVNPKTSSWYYPISLIVLFMLFRFLDRDRPGTYEEEKRRWILQFGLITYFVILIIGLSLLRGKSGHGIGLQSPFLWGVFMMGVIGQILDWRKIQKRKLTNSMDNHPLLKNKNE
ncbi:hypothetical protein P6P90_17320 [Ectobacillus antri]|jgi:hypothetical protein|uniref:Uncharacterized protein n=1 Tax=Ectobacillus antri TaxID=2486280 RepID=A0ABT6H991_9BACI|nr:hypothetical protein [Ectobacillus antri]MDG4658618.1 hypothetical protein [Ectobacillus antri]MDG5755650.1 hypothetical protein [Ectobacillus antri]